MFKDMRNPGIVWRVSLESNGEDIILVIACDVQVLCSCFIMLKVQRSQLQLRNVLSTFERKAMQLLAWLRIA